MAKQNAYTPKVQSTAACKRMHTRRLLKLADILAKHRERKNGKGTIWNMGTWGTHKDVSHEPEEVNFCGTIACALGHAAMDPGFRRAGLTLVWEEHLVWKGWDEVNKQPLPSGTSEYIATVMFDDHDNEYAGAYFFGLSHDEAYNLFVGDLETKAEVIKELRRLAKHRKELDGEGYGNS